MGCYQEHRGIFPSQQSQPVPWQELYILLRYLLEIQPFPSRLGILKHAHPAAKSAHSCFRLTSETVGNQEMCIPLQRSEPKSNKCFKCTFCPGSLKYYVYCSEEAEAEISTLSSNSVIKQAHICYEGHTLDCLH